MSNSQTTTGAAPGSLAMIATLGGIAALSGLLVVMVYQFTLPYINANQQAAIEHAIFKVIPGAVKSKAFTVTAKGAVAGDTGHGILVYAGYGKQGKLKGIAALASATGYQDIIKLLYGYSPKCQCITGIAVLESTETPGLGSKISTDRQFLANFKALDARVSASQPALANAIVTVKHGTKKHPWQIDAISGATISSTAVGRALNRSAQALLPKLYPHVNQLKEN